MLLYGECANEQILLLYVRRQLTHRTPVDHFTIHTNVPAHVQTAQIALSENVQQRRLACTAAAHYGHQFARLGTAKH